MCSLANVVNYFYFAVMTKTYYVKPGKVRDDCREVGYVRNRLNKKDAKECLNSKKKIIDT